MIDQSQITALFYLLEDPDNEVYLEIKKKLVSFGSELIPELENHWETSKSRFVQKRIESILQQIHFKALCGKLDFWANLESYDLLKGVLLACSYHFPKINSDNITFTVLNIKREITHNIVSLPPRELILQFNKMFFSDYRFRVVNKEGVSPKNFFINHLISIRKGEVISVSLLYVILARELNIPVTLVNISNNRCLLAYFKQSNLYNNYSPPAQKKQEILFFIDPTHQGNILSKTEVQRRFFKQNDLEWYQLRALNNKEMLILLFSNLKKYYENTNKQSNRLVELGHLIKVLQR